MKWKAEDTDDKPNGGLSRPDSHQPQEKQPNHTYYDQIEVDIVGGGGDVVGQKGEDALINANDFFLENNDNYRLSWEVRPCLPVTSSKS